MAKLVDLDALVGEDIKVKLDGEEYLLPADCPTPTFLKILHFGRQADEGQEPDMSFIEDLYEEILGLFQLRQPDLEELPIGLTQMVEAVGLIYGEGTEAEQPDPTPAKRRGTRSTKKPAARKASASSTS